MRLTADRSDLNAALRRAQGVISARNTIPILSNVCLSADGDELTLRSTNLDSELTETLPATVGEGGTTTVAADKLREISGLTVSRTISLDTKPSRLQVEAGRAKFDIPTQPAEDFPVFPSDKLGEPWRFPAGLLADMLSRVAFMREDEARANAFTGTYLTIDDGLLLAVTMRETGLALRRERAPQAASVAALLPPRLTDHLSKWLTGAKGEAEIATSEGLIRVACGGSVLTAKLLADRYPDHKRYLSEDQDRKVQLYAEELAAAVRRALICGDDRTATIRCDLSTGSMAVSARTARTAAHLEAQDELNCDYEGQPAMIRFFGHALIGALSNLKGDEVEIGFAHEETPSPKRWKEILRSPSDPGFIVNLMEPRV